MSQPLLLDIPSRICNKLSMSCALTLLTDVKVNSALRTWRGAARGEQQKNSAAANNRWFSRRRRMRMRGREEVEGTEGGREPISLSLLFASCGMEGGILFAL